MGQWLFEAGIGEDRAALIEDGEIVEAAIELPGLRAGTVAEARLATILIPRKRGIARLQDGSEALIEPVPAGVTEGASLRIEIVREAIPEAGRDKLPKAKASTEAPQHGPALRDRIGKHQESTPVGEDRLEAAGWSELIEEAVTGEIPFEGGALRMSLTPAMTLFDVDGALEPAALAVAGAAAVGRAIRRLGIGGSIGIDLPTLASKADRLAAAEALDAVLPQPFERTAVNGFGFLQVVRRRERPSIPELLRADPGGAAARALLRRAERTGGGAVEITGAPAVVTRLRQESAWMEALARRLGGEITLRADERLPISGGHVHHRIA